MRSVDGRANFLSHVGHAWRLTRMRRFFAGVDETPTTDGEGDGGYGCVSEYESVSESATASVLDRAIDALLFSSRD